MCCLACLLVFGYILLLPLRRSEFAPGVLSFIRILDDEGNTNWQMTCSRTPRVVHCQPLETLCCTHCCPSVQHPLLHCDYHSSRPCHPVSGDAVQASPSSPLGTETQPASTMSMLMWQSSSASFQERSKITTRQPLTIDAMMQCRLMHQAIATPAWPQLLSHIAAHKSQL